MFVLVFVLVLVLVFVLVLVLVRVLVRVLATAPYYQVITKVKKVGVGEEAVAHEEQMHEMEMKKLKDEERFKKAQLEKVGSHPSRTSSRHLAGCTSPQPPPSTTTRSRLCVAVFCGVSRPVLKCRLFAAAPA